MQKIKNTPQLCVKVNLNSYRNKLGQFFLGPLEKFPILTNKVHQERNTV